MLHRPELADLIDGAIGEGSPFHERFGYYAQGVGPETAVVPTGWQSRVLRIQNANTDQKVGLCLEPLDLAAAKLAAVSALIHLRGLANDFQPEDIQTLVDLLIGQALT